jgi:hypothetical protein
MHKASDGPRPKRRDRKVASFLLQSVAALPDFDGK